MPLGSIEESELNARKIGIYGHFAPQCVNFPYDMALGLTPHRRVAAHLANGINVPANQQGVRAHAGGSQSRFDPGMTGAAYNDIKGPLSADLHLLADTKGSEQLVQYTLIVNFPHDGFQVSQSVPEVARHKFGRFRFAKQSSGLVQLFRCPFQGFVMPCTDRHDISFGRNLRVAYHMQKGRFQSTNSIAREG